MRILIRSQLQYLWCNQVEACVKLIKHHSKSSFSHTNLASWKCISRLLHSINFYDPFHVLCATLVIFRKCKQKRFFIILHSFLWFLFFGMRARFVAQLVCNYDYLYCYVHFHIVVNREWVCFHNSLSAPDVRYFNSLELYKFWKNFTIWIWHKTKKWLKITHVTFPINPFSLLFPRPNSIVPNKTISQQQTQFARTCSSNHRNVKINLLCCMN